MSDVSEEREEPKEEKIRWGDLLAKLGLLQKTELKDFSSNRLEQIREDLVPAIIADINRGRKPDRAPGPVPVKNKAKRKTEAHGAELADVSGRKKSSAQRRKINKERVRSGALIPKHAQASLSKAVAEGSANVGLRLLFADSQTID